MKTFLILSTLLWTMGKPENSYAQSDAVKTLQLVAAKLNAATTLSYIHTCEINNLKDNSFYKSSANCFVDFTRDSSKIFKRFQLNSTNSLQVYNGADFFTLDKTNNTYELQAIKDQQYFSNLTYFYNSLVCLRNTLGSVIKDNSTTKRQSDTLLDGKQYVLIKLAMPHKTMAALGGFGTLSSDITVYYELILDGQLPYQLIEHNNLNKDQYFTRITYKDIRTDPKPLPVGSWQLSSYQTVYKPAVHKMQNPLIKTGAAITNWVLPVYKVGNTTTINNKALTGKLVLMDFWIKNCGYCMESFAHLKVLQHEFGNKGLQILAINALDPVADVAFFYRREKPGYQMLYNGAGLARQLGVYAFPTVVLVGANGHVIYAGDFDYARIEKLVEHQKAD